MSTIKSSNEHLTFNADGTSKEIRFQANGTQKASISSAGLFTSTTIDATKLTGALPAISGASLTGVGVAGITSSADATAITIDSSERVGIGTTSPTEPLTIRSSSENVNTVLLAIGNDVHATNTKDAWIRYDASTGGSADQSFAIGASNNSFRFVHLGTRATAPHSGTELMRIDSSGNVAPGADGTQDLGYATLRWANIYTGDLHLANTEGNDVDGTTGDWTIQEGDENLYIKNNKTGKKYKFKLEEIQ